MIYTLHLGTLGANCYIITTEANNCVAIDIGGHPKRFLGFLSQHNLSLRKILLTHGHFDHFDGVTRVVEETGAEVYIHEADLERLSSRELSFAVTFKNEQFYPIEKATTVKEGDVIALDELEFRVISTPGHTDGCVCYELGNMLFTGDTLFFESVGRTDFFGGDSKKLLSSLNKLSELETDYELYPGHGQTTTLFHEKQCNPYMYSL